MRKATAIWLAAALIGVGQAQAALLTNMSDTFGDGDFATNTDGIGNGFSKVGNGRDTAVQVETNGVATMTLSPTGDGAGNHGFVSKDQIDLSGGASEVEVVWDIKSFGTIDNNGQELLVQQETGFRGGNNFDLQIKAGGGIYVKYDGTQIDAGSHNFASSGSINLSHAQDGYTLTLNADATGWTITTTGMDDWTASADFGTSAGETFDDIFSDGYVAAMAQRNGDTHISLNSVSFNAIPEPATFGLLGFFGIVYLLRRRLNS